jgi:hypothetical protein
MAGLLILIATMDPPPLPAQTDHISNNGSIIPPLTLTFGLPRAHLPAEPPAQETISAIATERAAEAQSPFALDSNSLMTSSSSLSFLPTKDQLFVES